MGNNLPVDRGATAAEAGYRVELTALAVPRAESLLRTVERCINQGPAGRVVHVEDHDAPYNQSPKTLARLSQIHDVRLSVVDTDLTQLYPGQFPSAAAALKAGRTLTPDVKADVARRSTIAKQQLSGRDQRATVAPLRNSLSAVRR
ncbi:MAG: zeta toxin family protein, partial [Candidatus Nanopelagicales bacterium]